MTELPDDWFVEHDGQRLVLDPEKVRAAFDQVREYDRGKRDGIKYAVTWLQREALQMNDPWAKDILNRVADHLGKAGKQETINAKGDLLELALKRAAALGQSTPTAKKPDDR